MTRQSQFRVKGTRTRRRIINDYNKNRKTNEKKIVNYLYTNGFWAPGLHYLRVRILFEINNSHFLNGADVSTRSKTFPIVRCRMVIAIGFACVYIEVGGAVYSYNRLSVLVIWRIIVYYTVETAQVQGCQGIMQINQRCLRHLNRFDIPLLHVIFSWNKPLYFAIIFYSAFVQVFRKKK